MGVKIVETSERESAVLSKLKPGDTFETQGGDLYLVTDEENEDEGMRWDVIKLISGGITTIEDDEVVYLVDLEVSKIK